MSNKARKFNRSIRRHISSRIGRTPFLRPAKPLPVWMRMMMHQRPQPPQPDRIRSIRGTFSWIDHRFFRQGFDRGLTRLEKLLYLLLVAVSNREGVSFYSDERLGEILDIRHRHELTGARAELVARDLIAFTDGVYQVLDLPAVPKGP
jgi:hypothetical protein